MPLPTDEKLITLSQNLLKQFDTIFGIHPGFRPACTAKGNVAGWRIHAFFTGGVADAGGANVAEVHGCVGAFLQLNGNSATAGQ